MSTKLHDLATHATTGVSVAPNHYTADATGGAVDLLAADGNGFAVLAVGTVVGDSLFGGSLEESDDQTTWVPIPDVAFPVVADENTSAVVTFVRTRRFVRAVLDVSGDDGDGYACVLIGGQTKTV